MYICKKQKYKSRNIEKVVLKAKIKKRKIILSKC